MTTVTDLIHDVISYLVTQCQQNPALGAANPPVLVVDGPTASRDQVLTSPLRLWIGYDAVSGSPDAASAQQKFSFLGASGNYRDETASITCTAEAWSGDSLPGDGARASCKAIVGAVEIMLRGAPTTGPGDSTMGGLVQWSQVERLQWAQTQTENGYSAVCLFDVTYFARLAP